jgi:N-acetyl-anhydromuramyl-L-alanine amidase AmpD
MKKLDLKSIKQIPLPVTEYVNKDVNKLQIVLHHTAGNSSAPNVIKSWASDTRGRIATCVVISGKGVSKDTFDGEICQAFSSKKWAHHLGIKSDVFRANGVPFKALDPISIGIEICNWGSLEKRGDKFYNYVNREVSSDQVCILDAPYKGSKYYHAYTDAQIESVRQLLVYWSNLYKIPLTYKEKDMWEVSKNALSAVPGVYTHNSYRRDKSDVSPQPKLIEMLKSL